MESAESAWDLVLTLHTRVEQELARALRRYHGLGLTEYRALRRLSHTPKGSLRMQVLAEAVGLNQSSVSRLVERLERDGLTARDICEQDRRGVYTMITEAGRLRCAAAGTTYDKTLSAVLAELTADAELGALVRTLLDRSPAASAHPRAG